MLSAKASKGKIILNQIHPYEKVRENSTLARKKGYFFKEERALIFSQYNYFLLGNLHKTLSNKDKKKPGVEAPGDSTLTIAVSFQICVLLLTPSRI